ncbi:hypothetical protein DNTS_028250, partial [Danionella cerebrum]
MRHTAAKAFGETRQDKGRPKHGIQIKQSLKRKFKTERAPLVHNDEVRKSKEKFGHKKAKLFEQSPADCHRPQSEQSLKRKFKTERAPLVHNDEVRKSKEKFGHKKAKLFEQSPADCHRPQSEKKPSVASATGPFPRWLFRAWLSTHIQVELGSCSSAGAGEALKKQEAATMELGVFQHRAPKSIPQLLLDIQAQRETTFVPLTRGRRQDGLQHRVINPLIGLDAVSVDGEGLWLENVHWRNEICRTEFR